MFHFDQLNITFLPREFFLTVNNIFAEYICINIIREYGMKKRNRYIDR